MKELITAGRVQKSALCVLLATFGLVVAPEVKAAATPPAATDWELLVVDYGTTAVRHYSSAGANLGVITSSGLSIPDGIAVDKSGNFYVGNTANSTVRKFSPTGQDLGVFASAGLSAVRGLAFDANGNLYVVNSGNSTVRRFAPNGQDLGVFATNGLETPTGIAFDTNGNVYVSNFGASTVRKFSPAGQDLGNFISDMPPQMEDLTFDAAGNLYVVSYGANLVRRYSASGQNLGNFVTNFPSPESIVFTPDGNLLISSYSSGFIRKYSTSGQELGTFASTTNGLTLVNRMAIRRLPLPSNSTLSDGLVAYYPFNGNANDESGYEKHGTVQGAVLTSDRFGTPNRAYSFNGGEQRITTVGEHGLPTGSNDFCMSIWVAVDWPGAVSDFRFMVGNSAFSQFQWNLNTGTDKAVFFYIGGQNGASGEYMATTNLVWTHQQWHHLVITRSNNLIVMYRDGVPIGSKLFVTGNNAAVGSRNLTIGRRYDGAHTFQGRLDDLRAYNRALSPNEIQQLYTTEAVTPPLPTPPIILTQPQPRTVHSGESASFSVSVSGTPPFTYQWRLNGTNLINSPRISGASSAQLFISNVQLSDAGLYSVVVSNSVTSVTSSNSTLTVTPPTAAVRVVNTMMPSGGFVSVPITLMANGNENALGFTLNLGSQVSPPLLAYDSADLGSDANGALLLVNTNQLASSRRIGIALALPAGTTFPAGLREIIRVRFASGLLTGFANRTMSLSFGSAPTPQQLSDPATQLLPVTFNEALVTLTPSDVEGDSSPRTNGNRVVDLSDWVQVGRFVAKLDALPSGSEYQRADCAPRDSQGNGRLNVNDWVQAGRYAAGLDPLQAAGGPNREDGFLPAAAGSVSIASASRNLRVSDVSALPGQVVAVPVILESQGDENALSFSFSFNPEAFTYTGLSWGTNGIGLSTNVNTTQIAAGRLGVVAGLSIGKTFATGVCELLKINLKALSAATPGSYPIDLGDLPVSRGLSDPNAGELNATYTPATANVALPKLKILKQDENITLSWPESAGEFTLQALSSELLPGAAWTNVAAPLQTNQGAVSITLPLSAEATFYRLNKP